VNESMAKTLGYSKEGRKIYGELKAVAVYDSDGKYGYLTSWRWVGSL